MSSESSEKWSKIIIGSITSAVVGLILEIFVNEYQLTTWLWGNIVSLIYDKILVWQILTFLLLITLVGYIGLRLFQGEYRTDHVLEIDWRSKWDGDDPVRLEPICPECGLELNLTSKTLGATDSQVPGVRGVESSVCAVAQCDRCGFEKEWQDITGTEFHTVDTSQEANLEPKILDAARKRISARRRQ